MCSGWLSGPAVISPRYSPRNGGTPSAQLDDGRIEELTSGREAGAGIRVVVGETTGFAYTADLSEPGLRAAADAAAAAARNGGGGVNQVALTRVDAVAPNQVAILPETVSKASKVQLLQRANEAARSAGGAVRQVSATYGDSRRRILVANSEGVLAGDDQVKTRFSVSCVAVGDTGLQTGRESVGLHGRVGAVRDLRRRGAGPAGGGEGHAEAVGPAGAERRHARGPEERQRRRPLPRGVRPRPGGRPHRPGRLGVPGSGRRAGGQPARHPGRRRHHGPGVGSARHRRRGPPGRPQRPHRRTASSPTTCGTGCGPARRAGRARATAGARATSTSRWSA